MRANTTVFPDPANPLIRCGPSGASIAALTIYDMCKSISHNIIIKETVLLEKSGGKSDISNER